MGLAGAAGRGQRSRGGTDRLPGVTPEQLGQLQQQIYALQAENEGLRQQLGQIAQRQQAKAEMRSKVVRGGGRLLLPLIDRQKVVRSFGSLAETTSRFTGPREQWPERDHLLDDARRFLESLVRFAVRRRMLLLLLSLFGAVIPGIQIWLVVQQNQIIENQNEFFEIQVYDIVARSMTEGDRNARLMTGALLSRAEPEFLAGVVEEAFDPDVSGLFREEAVEARTRRLEDAAFRGYLVQAVVRSVQKQVATRTPAEVGVVSLPMLQLIVRDAGSRVYEVLRLGERGGEIDDGLAEQVDGYLTKEGEAMRVYGRLARATGETTAYFEDLAPYLRRVAKAKLAGNHFEKAHRFALEALLFELAAEPDLDDPPHVDLDAAGLSPEEARAKGLQVLRERVEAEGIDWGALARQVEGT